MGYIAVEIGCLECSEETIFSEMFETPGEAFAVFADKYPHLIGEVERMVLGESTDAGKRVRFVVLEVPC